MTVMVTPVEPRGVAGMVERYLRLIGAGDEPAAVAMVTDLLAGGASPETVLLEVIGAAQSRVGQLWAENRWSVAREHAATAISERAVAAVAARTPVDPVRGRVTVACTDGEWHSLPVRLVGELLRLGGWRIDYLGAAVPGPHLVTHLQQTDADTVALSCLLPTRLPSAHAAITASQSAGVPVLAGGPGFGRGGRYALLLGAAGWAPRADAAVDRLVAPDWPPRLDPPPRTPHLPGEEYHLVAGRRAELVSGVLRRLPARYRSMPGYDDRQRESTVDGLGYLVDILAAARYVGDTTVLTDFAAWNAQVLAARGMPAAALVAGLEILGDLLADAPLARAMLTAAIRQVAGGR
jgi:methanogenic corrinoid protein MtbC1